MRINASIFILGATILFPATLVVTYSLSIFNKHVEPFWPYISHTGNYPIESCFFSLGLNIVSGIYAAITFFRFGQIKSILIQEPNDLYSIVNKSSIFWGLISSFGLSITSSVQQKNLKYVHLFAAVICSYTANIYFWHQTYLSTYCTRFISRKIKVSRVILVVCSTVIHSIGPYFYIYSVLSRQSTDEAVKDGKAMALRPIGSFMEWSVFIFNELYVASFYWEFQDIYFKIGRLIIERNVNL